MKFVCSEEEDRMVPIVLPLFGYSLQSNWILLISRSSPYDRYIALESGTTGKQLNSLNIYLGIVFVAIEVDWEFCIVLHVPESAL